MSQNWLALPALSGRIRSAIFTNASPTTPALGASTNTARRNVSVSSAGRYVPLGVRSGETAIIRLRSPLAPPATFTAADSYSPRHSSTTSSRGGSLGAFSASPGRS